jgi:hypothetical protein
MERPGRAPWIDIEDGVQANEARNNDSLDATDPSFARSGKEPSFHIINVLVGELSGVPFRGIKRRAPPAGDKIRDTVLERYNVLGTYLEKSSGNPTGKIAAEGASECVVQDLADNVRVQPVMQEEPNGNNFEE